MSEGFIGRWSRRKLDAKEGRLPEPEPAVEPSPPVVPEAPAVEAPPPPTLDDVKVLTAESDFSRFAAADVAPDVKNAALKKLFADPRYNVMDGLDVYTGDFTQADPIPESMMKQLASAKFLGLFEDKDEADGPAAAREVADDPAGESVAQSAQAPPAVPEPTDADPDLRLQQDDAAEGPGPGRGAA